MKIISAEIYNEQKKIILLFENDTAFSNDEILDLEQVWRKKLKADSSVNIEIKVQVPQSEPEKIFTEEEVVEIPFSIEQYEEAQRESIRLAAQNMKNSSGGYSSGGTYQRKKGNEYSNKGDGKYSKKKKTHSRRGRGIKKRFPRKYHLHG